MDNLWGKCKTFQDMIDLNIKFINDEINQHPMTFPAALTKNLQEESYEIIEYLIKLNENGFFTESSQPTKELYKNNIKYKQRAYCSGFMKRELADKIFNINQNEFVILINDEFNKIEKRRNYDDTCKYASATFKNNNIAENKIKNFEYLHYISNLMNVNINNIHDYWTTNFCNNELELYLENDDSHEYYISEDLYDKINKEVVAINIMDYEWNRSDKNHFWINLLKML